VPATAGPAPTAPAAATAVPGPTATAARRTGPGSPAPDGVPGHLVKPTPGPWAMWRWVGLRAAGFPLDLLTALGDVDLVAAADAVLAAEDHLDTARRDLADRLRRVRAAAPADERARWNRA
ncbi:hypothetical protein AAFH96_32565, partial [Polymorphospora sp. 2-325]